MRNALEPLLRVSKCRIWPISGPLVLCFQPPANGTATGAYQRGVTELLDADVLMDALSFGQSRVVIFLEGETAFPDGCRQSCNREHGKKSRRFIAEDFGGSSAFGHRVATTRKRRPASESDRFARNDGDRQSYLAIDEPPRLRAVDKLVRSLSA